MTAIAALKQKEEEKVQKILGKKSYELEYFLEDGAIWLRSMKEKILM